MRDPFATPPLDARETCRNLMATRRSNRPSLRLRARHCPCRPAPSGESTRYARQLPSPWGTLHRLGFRALLPESFLPEEDFVPEAESSSASSGFSDCNVFSHVSRSSFSSESAWSRWGLTSRQRSGVNVSTAQLSRSVRIAWCR